MNSTTSTSTSTSILTDREENDDHLADCPRQVESDRPERAQLEGGTNPALGLDGDAWVEDNEAARVMEVVAALSL